MNKPNPAPRLRPLTQEEQGLVEMVRASGEPESAAQELFARLDALEMLAAFYAGEPPPTADDSDTAAPDEAGENTG